MNRFLADENLPLPVVAETNNFLTKKYYISPQSKVGLS